VRGLVFFFGGVLILSGARFPSCGKLRYGELTFDLCFDVAGASFFSFLNFTPLPMVFFWKLLGPAKFSGPTFYSISPQADPSILRGFLSFLLPPQHTFFVYGDTR